jgi:hypothetical protein
MRTFQVEFATIAIEMNVITKKPFVIAVCGFSSNVGKTTLICELIQRLSGWEAVKLTRGHYRSCGKDPAGCCVSDLLTDEPLVRSGRENYERGKDTGRFWDAGASNVHWVIATDSQVEQGIHRALGRVETEGVVIEGNSFLDYINADLTLMCARATGGTVKSSARRTLKKCDFLYLSSLDSNDAVSREQFATFCAAQKLDLGLDRLPILTHKDLDDLTRRVCQRMQIEDMNRLSVCSG